MSIMRLVNSSRPPPADDPGEPPDAVAEWAERVIATWRLTTGEKRVCRLVLKGLSDEEIAGILDLSLGTTKSHLCEIRRKAGVGSRAELFAEILRL